MNHDDRTVEQRIRRVTILLSYGSDVRAIVSKSMVQDGDNGCQFTNHFSLVIHYLGSRCEPRLVSPHYRSSDSIIRMQTCAGVNSR